jgi:hypothetical protein
MRHQAGRAIRTGSKLLPYQWMMSTQKAGGHKGYSQSPLMSGSTICSTSTMYVMSRMLIQK